MGGSGAMSTRIKQFHADRSGLASAEFILSIPVFLIMLVVIMDLGKIRTGTLHGVIAARNSAWAESAGGTCLFRDEMPDFVSEASTLVPTGCSQRTLPETGSTFWSDLDEAGGQRLTGTVSGATSPVLIEAKVNVQFDPHDWPAMTVSPADYSFTMLSRQTFMHSENALRVGYDREMQARFQEGTGRLMELFPNVFPGAR